jgi:hypothetical protein
VGSDYPVQVALGSGAAWVAHVAGGYGSGGLTRLDLATRRATTRLRLAGGPVFGVAANAHGAWALSGPTDEATVARVDPRSGRRLGVVRGVHRPTSIAADDSGLWIATVSGWILHGARKVVRLPAHSAPARIALADGTAWAAGGGTVVRIDERRNRSVARLRVHGVLAATAAGPRALWLLLSQRLVRVDASTTRIDGQTRVPSLTTSVSVGAGGVWLGTAEPIPRVVSVDPKTLALRTLARLL